MAGLAWLSAIPLAGFFAIQGFDWHNAGMCGISGDVTQRKLAKRALTDMTRKLIEAQEQERGRIGRELHHDINERLAMLAVDLEQLQANPSEVQSRVQELQKQASQLSDDVQALSHDLHASKLQYLGILWHYSRLSLCSKLPVLSHNSLDSICSTLSGTMPRSLRSRFSVEGQLAALHGDGRVLMQSTSQQLSLLPTWKGKVAPADVRRLVETMRAAQFLDLPQKSYMMMNADAQARRKL